MLNDYRWFWASHMTLFVVYYVCLILHPLPGNPAVAHKGKVYVSGGSGAHCPLKLTRAWWLAARQYARRAESQPHVPSWAASLPFHQGRNPNAAQLLCPASRSCMSRCRWPFTL